ncbi:antitoxin component YwqK of YwqJK toxin-antitoxin module [Flavobacterium sp. 81]|uniref:toxin-antitoxin system YwqK family antitoxin n=1 Tax=Flavobacterium sp. 81 TaxID=2135621 RepID=UPI000F1E6844|nr:antitoxin component YwqK of YwqJK toxin-antitoxin module [Flavobacterium sp. 81]
MICRKIIIGLLFLNALLVSAQDSNKLDANGKKDGVWKGVYEVSKRPRYEGTFSHGKETGIFKYFDDTKKGDVLATRDFSANDGSAYNIFYDQNKNKVSEGKVIGRNNEGEWKYYHKASKVVMTLENYKNGKLEGSRTIYYPDAKIAEEMTYKNGLREGIYKKFGQNGILLEQTTYGNDQYNGDAIFYDSEGTIASKGKFFEWKKSWKVAVLFKR